MPRSIWPLMQISGSSVAISATSNSFSASCSGKLIAQMKAAHGDGADAAPLAIAHLEDALDQLLRRHIAVTA